MVGTDPYDEARIILGLADTLSRKEVQDEVDRVLDLFYPNRASLTKSKTVKVKVIKDETPEVPKRRGRPPGSKNKANLAAADLAVERLEINNGPPLSDLPQLPSSSETGSVEIKW